jgi:hypothetical protein
VVTALLSRASVVIVWKGPVASEVDVDIAPVHVFSRYKVTSAVSDTVRVTVGERDMPGDTGEIEVKLSVGEVESMTMFFWPARLLALPKLGRPSAALLPDVSLMEPPLTSNAEFEAYSRSIELSPALTT